MLGFLVNVHGLEASIASSVDRSLTCGEGLAGLKHLSQLALNFALYSTTVPFSSLASCEGLWCQTRDVVCEGWARRCVGWGRMGTYC